MLRDNAAPLVPADQTARELRGDCRHYALLTAALCRAQGIPARTAIGLIYVKPAGQGPVLGFHMWTEVWVNGRWLGIDATLGQGSVGAGHLKIADTSWNDVQTLAPLLPVVDPFDATLTVLRAALQCRPCTSDSSSRKCARARRKPPPFATSSTPLSAPTRCVTVRLKRLTCSIAACIV